MNKTPDFIFLGKVRSVYIKIDTSGNIYRDDPSSRIETWTLTPNHGYNFSNIIDDLKGGYLAIGTRPANEISSRIIVEANDQVSAKKYGEILLNNSATLLYDGSIPPDNIKGSMQEKYVLDTIESNDSDNSISLGSKLQLQITDYLQQF
jgi:hypothetical protein